MKRYKSVIYKIGLRYLNTANIRKYILKKFNNICLLNNRTVITHDCIEVFLYMEVINMLIKRYLFAGIRYLNKYNNIDMIENIFYKLRKNLENDNK